MSDNGALLEVENLHKRFGELRAVDGVSLKFTEGETTALIGPNGAGKTTLFNLVTARLAPDRGRVRFAGDDITGSASDAIARRGLVRTFQVSSIFPTLSVSDNILTGMLSRLGRSSVATRSLRREDKASERTSEIMEKLRLTEVAHVACKDLSHGDRRRVEIGMSLGLEPRMMLLDEPTSGMAPAERRSTAELLADLAQRGEATLLLTEHDIDLVMKLARRVVVMHEGRIIADGAPQDIAEDEEVRRAYLGEAR